VRDEVPRGGESVDADSEWNYTSGKNWEVMMKRSCTVGVAGVAETAKAALKRRSPYWVRAVVAIIVGILWGSVARPQGGGQDTKDACAPVQAAYLKTASESNSSKATNTGGLNVAEAYEKITSEPGHKETCKYLRDEAVTGEDANVYNDVFASKSGMANGTVWISKKDGWVLKREVDVTMNGVGKGHQSIVFEYPRK
jgi:hypothetical protein